MISALTSRFPKPQCIEEGRAVSWRDPQILDRLWPMFGKKCYLTEAPIGQRLFEVDHRHPKSAPNAPNPLDWDNLYPASGLANRIRKRGWPAGGLLHPDGREGHDINSRLHQQLDINGPSQDILCTFAAVDPSDIEAKNTAEELNRIHHNSDNEISSSNDLRVAIRTQMELMLRDSLNLIHAKETSNYQVLESRFRTLYLDATSPYSALIKSIVPEVLRYLIT